MNDKSKPPTTFPKLEITCSSTDCENSLHYYGPSKRKQSLYPVGKCRVCGAELVDWDRIQQCLVKDVNYTFQMLQTECWRHKWWHIEVDEKAANYARRKGKLLLEEAVRKLLSKKVGTGNNPWDGRQTPKSGNVIFYAQHATATCCRICIEYWHGIPRGRNITESELDYMTQLIMLYISKRMPDLADQGIYVKRIQRSHVIRR